MSLKEWAKHLANQCYRDDLQAMSFDFMHQYYNKIMRPEFNKSHDETAKGNEK